MSLMNVRERGRGCDCEWECAVCFHVCAQLNRKEAQLKSRASLSAMCCVVMDIFTKVAAQEGVARPKRQSSN
ncbi:hypothetical protein INR49_005924 [Caranx melampygus]|nr:hypothetical protein INR49_005924 [Caranx melampygus]